jgi:hypothetical protein
MSLISFNNWAAGEGANPLIPHTAELIVGFVAFSLLFLVLRSKVVPMFEKAFGLLIALLQIWRRVNNHEGIGWFKQSFCFSAAQKFGGGC